MTRKSCCSRKWPQPAISLRCLLLGFVVAAALALNAPCARANEEAPQWMHALANLPMPTHDDEADAILLYSEKNVTVLSASKVRISVRRAYRILRPGGRRYGHVHVIFGSHEKVLGLRGWCIPATGKDYQIKDKDAAESSLAGIAGSELISDVKERYIQIPSPDPGSIIGYEYETEEQPFVLQDKWTFQDDVPVRETHYSLELPAGWSYLTKWANYQEINPVTTGNNRCEWTLSDVKRIRDEEDMPPLQSIAGRMVIYFVPPGEPVATAFTDWKQMGEWQRNLSTTRLDTSANLRQTVTSLVATAATPVAKMQAVAQFVQQNVRYVAIELGIGGFQPHPATEVLSHRYGDCKDKATLTISLLREIGVESYYVIVNAYRGAVTMSTPPHVGAFNHAIIAVRLPEGVADPSLVAVLQHPKYGRLLLFDPTNEFVPFGQIAGHLQGGYGLLVTPDGGDLVQLPTLPLTMNSIQRTAKLVLDGSGVLTGDVSEIRTGDKAWREREKVQNAAKDFDRIKPIDEELAGSLSDFHIVTASLVNENHNQLPLGFKYSFEAPHYSRNAGSLILVRPRVFGVKARNIVKTKEPRQYAFEFNGVGVDTDSFDIAIPAGYEVDDLPASITVDYSFASYHSITEVQGTTIRYHRTYVIKQASVPVDQIETLKHFYQAVANDERSMVVLKPVSR